MEDEQNGRNSSMSGDSQSSTASVNNDSGTEALV